MLYNDPIYGTVKITEPVLMDLMNSVAMQRLHGVLQHGVSALVGITRKTSRFEHSVGVMLLVRRLGASLDEQIAALLHDVSHTAFSHVIDYVFHSHNTQGYHEEHKHAYVSGTDIPKTLEKHGYDWLDFMEEEKFTILEQDLPRLCADRLDYFFRDVCDLRLATHEDVQIALDHLKPHQGQIAVDDIDIARWLGYTFIEGDKASWANFREVGLYELAARAIRRGMKIGVLVEDDLWGTDQPAWEKLQASPDPELQYDFQRVHPDTQFVWNDNTPEFRVSTKLRSIDPAILIKGQVAPLSVLDPKFNHYRSDYLARNSGKWPMQVICPEEQKSILRP